MVFSSFVFLFAFLPVTLFLYYIVFRKSILWQNITLLLTSLLFYAWGEPTIVFLMILSIIANYLFGIAVTKVSRKKLILALSIIFNFSFLFVFKYFNFAVGNISSLLGYEITSLRFELPIGISFYTFQAMSYVIDVYRGDVKSQKNPLYIGLYISFFPQLIAGPIVRYSDIETQITERCTSIKNIFVNGGVERFIVGLAKKIIIANNVGFLADKMFGIPTDNLSMPLAWLGIIAYSLQIYFDFSGYSDMAIGLGLMFGFKFEENFNYPYISKSITEFWRRWHISLGTWFRDYLYISLGGNRVGKSRHIFNLFIVWFCTGLWHGANWTFIVWGLYYFVFLLFEKITGIEKKSGIFGHIYTLFAVMIGWVLFRSETVSGAIDYIKKMFDLSGPVDFYDLMWYIKNFAFYIVFGLIGSMPFVPRLKRFSDKWWFGYAKFAVLMGMFVFAISFMFRSTYNPFIYFNF